MNNETTASQPKSIGDDAWKSLTTYIGKEIERIPVFKHEEFVTLEDVIALLKLRAPAAQASATIQAAPPVHPTKEMISSGMCWLSNFQNMRKADKENALSEAYFAMVAAAPAATIQEPVMVAEPVMVSLGDTWADSCKVCQQRADFGIATQKGPDGCREALESGETYCSVHINGALKARAAPMVADPAGAAGGIPPGCRIAEDNPYYGSGLPAENWQRGYNGERFLGYKNSGAYAIYREGVVARKALAATVKVVPKIRITLRQARRLVDFFGGYDADVTVTERSADWEQVEEGLYAFCTEYPEDGAQFLGATETDDELMRLGTVKAVPSEALELAAQKCDDLYAEFNRDDYSGQSIGARCCAAAIREMKIAAPLADKTGGGDHE